LTDGISLQRADPLGTLSGRALTLTAAAAIVLFSLVFMVAAREDITDWPAAIVGLVCAAVTAILLVIMSSPKRGPVSRGWAVWVLFFGIAGHLASVVSYWPAAPRVNDWGPYVVAVLLLALVPYRPIRDILAFTAVLSVWVVGITIAQESVQGGAVAGLAAVMAVTPVLALPLAGAAFVMEILRSVRRWRINVLTAAEDEAQRREAEITRAVQETRVGILNRDVVPFYSELISRNKLEATDAHRAAELAGAIREVMLADTQRSWLDELIAADDDRQGGAIRTGVRDPNGLARLMNLNQRTALRALINTLREKPGGGLVGVTLHTVGDGCEAILAAVVDGHRYRIASRLRPYLAVMGAVFSEFSYEIRADRLTVRFCYDRP